MVHPRGRGKNRADRLRSFALNHALGFFEAPLTVGNGIGFPVSGPGVRSGDMHKPRQREVKGDSAARKSRHACGGESDAVIRKFAGDDLGARGLALQLPISANELQRGLVGLAAAVAKHRVLEPRWRELGELRGEANGGFRSAVEKRRVVGKLRHLRSDRVHDFAASIPDIYGPKPGERIEKAAAFGIFEPHPGAFRDDVRARRVHILMIRKRMQMMGGVQLLKW